MALSKEMGKGSNVPTGTFILFVTFLPLIFIALLFSTPSLAGHSPIEPERELQEELEASRVEVRKIKDAHANGRGARDDTARLKARAKRIEAAHQRLLEKFQAREEEMKALGSKAAERHRTMEDGYQRAIEEYLSILKGLQAGEDVSDQQIESLETVLNKILHKKQKQLHGTLPYRHLNYPSREPSADPPIKPAYKGGNKVVSPEDTNETEEAPLSEEIANLAQSLNWNPVSIYEYVKNNIDTEWYWGCMKGAEETLHQKSGNDCDQATLLVALLRASGFPSRYVRGSIEFFAGRDAPINKIRNLLGINDPLKIAEFFQKAGIPFKPIIAGGTISNFQIEHIWVEGQIPYSNYRGAVIDDKGKTWLGFDTSIKVKNYQYNSPIDILQEMSLSNIRDQYFSAMQTQTPLEYLRATIGGQLNQNHPGKTYNDLLWSKTLSPEVMNILPASMQFDQKTITHEYTAIPDDLKHKMTFTATDVNNNELFSITLDTLDLSNQKVVLSYEPETVEDQQIIDSYGGLDNTPAYLVKLRPILKVNGEMIAAGNAGLSMGGDQNLTINVVSPNGTEIVQTTNVTGNLVVIGIAAQKTGSDQLLSIASNDDAEEILFKETQNYINRWNQAEGELASLVQVNLTKPIPTVTTVGGVIDVAYVLDTPHAYAWKGIFTDANLRAIEATSSSSPIAQGGGDRLKTFMQLSALEGSILENRIFEDDFQVDSISTAKLFEIANSNQTPFLTIDRTNIVPVLPTLPFDNNIKEDITNAVNQNLTVTIPDQAITYKDWTGIGYIKENPDTRESGYMLSGMIAGGETAQTPEQWANQFLMNLLGRPFTGKPNLDPMSAAQIIKIPVTDGQYGTANTPLQQPLAVLVIDKTGGPVQGASVTFKVIAGKGSLGGSGLISVTTASNGIAKAQLTLGKNTSHNPSYITLNTGDEFLTQVGLNVVSASASSSSGDISMAQPFNAYGKPDVPAQVIKGLGDGNRGVVNSPVGSLAAKLADQYGNPISNAILTFTVELAASLNPAVPLPDNYRNLKFYKKEECSNPYPMFGDCPNYYDSLNIKTDWSGKGLVWAVLGNTVNTQYTVKATFVNLPAAEFVIQSMGSRDKANYYLRPGVHMGYIAMVNDKGEPVNAAKAGMQLKAPVSAGLYMYYDDYTVGDSFTCTVRFQPTTCWHIKPSGTVQTKKIADGAVTFTPTPGVGSVTPTANLGNGLYQTLYTTGLEPAANTIEAKGQATIAVPQIFYDPNSDTFIATSQSPPMTTIVLQSGQEVAFDITTGGYFIPDTIPSTQTLEYIVYGVLPIIMSLTPNGILLDPDGFLTQDTTVNYSIEPSEYDAIIADIDIYARSKGSTNPGDDIYVFSLTGDRTQGDGTATLFEGYYFDASKDYYAEVVLNRGSDNEIRGGCMGEVMAKMRVSSMDTMPCDERVRLTLSPLHIELVDSGGNTVDPNGYVYISDAPQMPQLTAALKPDGLSGTINWQIKIEYGRDNRNDVDVFPTNEPANLSVDSPWDISAEFGSTIRGGRATITWEYLGVTSPQAFVFHIRGTNETESAAANQIGDTPWYARAIARHESNNRQQHRYYAQFNEIGTLGPAWSDSEYCPNWGYPHGWGVMQLEFPYSASASTLWDWQTNVSVGLYAMGVARSDAQAYFNAIRRTFPDEWEDPPTYTPPGTSTVLSALDAASIQLYNGASVVRYDLLQPNGVNTGIYRSCWLFDDNKPSGARWSFKENSTNPGYVTKIIKEYELNQ